MKRTELFQTKGYFRTVGAVLGLLLFMACSKDPIEEGATLGQGTIRFEVTESDKSWQTRSSDVDETPEVQVIKMQGATSADTLFLHATVTRGIEPLSRQDTTMNSQSPQTRVAETTANSMTSFGLLATLYPNPASEWNEGNNEFKPNYIYNANVQKSQNWTLSSYRWPVGQRLRLVAYSPNVNSNNITLSDITKTGNPTLTYIIPSTLANQRDLVVAVSDVGVTAQTNAVDMDFQHVLTGIQLTADANIPSGKIKRVSFTGIHNQSTLTMGLNNITWGPTSKAEGTWNYEKTFGDGLAVGGGTAVDVLMGETRMMMMPQTLPADAKMNIVYADNTTGTEQTLSASLSGSTWQQGTTVTYNLSLSSSTGTPTFTVTPSANTVQYDGGTVNISLTSQQTVSVGSVSNTVPLSWSVESILDGSNNDASSWVSVSSESGEGGASTSLTMTIGAQRGVFNAGTASRTLQDAAAKSTRFDLSTNGDNDATNKGNRSTANCYLVNCAGDYAFPLIYGNGRKNGTDNVAAYTYRGSGTGENFLPVLYNYLGNPISSPRINEDCSGRDPFNAILLWSDAPDVVTDVKIGTGGDGAQMIFFSVPKESIRQCNAVLALRDNSNRIMWSWHIWVTPYVLGTGDLTVNNSEKSFQMMSVNLGWRSAESGTFAQREVTVTFVQAGTNEKRKVTVTQQQYTYDVPYSTPYYQWGRKDPLLPATTGGADTPVYTFSNNYRLQWSSATAYIQHAIQNPTIFYGGNVNPDASGNWMDTPRYNLWDASAGYVHTATNTVVKTVYDPSPVGYCIPPSRVFFATTVTNDGSSASSYGSYVNGTYDAENFWWNFYCQPNSSGGATYSLPLLGVRNPVDGAVDNFHVECMYWTAHSYSDDPKKAFASNFYARSAAYMIYPQISAGKNFACTVRPIREQ